MARMQLFEIHDQPWCPALIRDALTDFLQTATEFFDTYGPIRSQLFEAIAKSKPDRILDLCSGAGGPWYAWRRGTKLPAETVLTVLYPNRAVIERLRIEANSDVGYHPDPIGATRIDFLHQFSFRTMFSAFHHFSPSDAQAIVSAAVKRGDGIGIFEMTERSVRNIVSHLFFDPIGVLVLTPRMRNVSWARLVLTYILPVIPLVAMIDGVLSCLRSYSVEELVAFTRGNHHYHWLAGKLGGITFLIGRPADGNAD
jgi:hypothetical protein